MYNTLGLVMQALIQVCTATKTSEVKLLAQTLCGNVNEKEDLDLCRFRVSRVCSNFYIRHDSALWFLNTCTFLNNTT